MDKLVRDAKATERQAGGVSVQGDNRSVTASGEDVGASQRPMGVAEATAPQGETNAVEAANDKGMQQNAAESEKKAATRADSKARTQNIRETRGGQYAAVKGKTRHAVDGTSFTEDKYYARQIDKWEDLKDYSYVTVGVIQDGSPLHQVGLPTGKIFFDVSKIRKAMQEHGDHLDKTVLKQIPDLLNEPVVIVEYNPGENTNTVNVYGNLMVGNSPVAVGVMMRPGRGGNIVTRVRTVHARRDFANQITDESVLYLDPNKKETLQWFQARGNLNVPLGGTKFGLIRSIAYSEQNVKRKNSHSVEDSSNQQTSADNKIGTNANGNAQADNKNTESENKNAENVNDAEEKRKARQEQAAMAGEAWEASRANREGNLTMIEELRTEARTKRAVKAIREFEQLSPEIRRRIYSMMESAEQNGVDERTQRRLAVLLALDAGLEIRFDEHVRAEGFYRELSGGAALIVVRPDGNEIQRVLTHEFAHELQNQPGYENVRRAILRAVGIKKDGETSEAYEKIKRAVISDHKAFGEELDAEDVAAEVEARILAQQLGNEKFWRQFERPAGVKGALRRVADFFRARGDRAKRYDTDAAREAAEATRELVKQVNACIEAIGQRSMMGKSARGQSGGRTQYSLDENIGDHLQDQKKPTPKAQHYVESSYGVPKQQTSGGIPALLSSLGIKGAVPEIKENLTKLQRMAGKADADQIMVKKTVKTLAMSMARDAKLLPGESYETAAVRIRDRLLSWVEANEIKAETVRANRAECQEFLTTSCFFCEYIV